VAMARRDSAEVSLARYTVTGSELAGAVGTAGAVAPAGLSEVSMALQITSGKDHYHNRSSRLGSVRTLLGMPSRLRLVRWPAVPEPSSSLTASGAGGGPNATDESVVHN
jgi:hypothetical protein